MKIRQSPSGPNLDNPSFSRHDNGNSNAAVTVDFSSGALQLVIVNANTTISIAPGPVGEKFQGTIHLNHGPGFTTAFAAGLRTPGGTPLTLSTGAAQNDFVNALWDGAHWNLTVYGLNFVAL